MMSQGFQFEETIFAQMLSYFAWECQLVLKFDQNIPGIMFTQVYGYLLQNEDECIVPPLIFISQAIKFAILVPASSRSSLAVQILD